MSEGFAYCIRVGGFFIDEARGMEKKCGMVDQGRLKKSFGGESGDGESSVCWFLS